MPWSGTGDCPFSVSFFGSGLLGDGSTRPGSVGSLDCGTETGGDGASGNARVAPLGDGSTRSVVVDSLPDWALDCGTDSGGDGASGNAGGAPLDDGSIRSVAAGSLPGWALGRGIASGTDPAGDVGSALPLRSCPNGAVSVSPWRQSIAMRPSCQGCQTVGWKQEHCPHSGHQLPLA